MWKPVAAPLLIAILLASSSTAQAGCGLAQQVRDIEDGFSSVAAAESAVARDRALAALVAKLDTAEVAALPEVDGRRIYPDTEYGRYLASRRAALNAIASRRSQRAVNSLLQSGGAARAANGDSDANPADCPTRETDAPTVWNGRAQNADEPTREAAASVAGSVNQPRERQYRPRERRGKLAALAFEESAAAGHRDAASFLLGAGIAALAMLCFILFRPRRRERRLLCYFPITVQSDGDEWEAKVVNISRSGAKLAGCPPDVRPDQPMQAKMGGQERTGLIVWVRELHCGVRFDTPLTRSQLRETLAGSSVAPEP